MQRLRSRMQLPHPLSLWSNLHHILNLLGRRIVPGGNYRVGNVAVCFLAWCSVESGVLIDHSEACRALPSFELTLFGGDGNIVQTCKSLQNMWNPRPMLYLDANCCNLDFVGYWPPKKTVIVAHQGTDPLALWVTPTQLDWVIWILTCSKSVSVATDVQALQLPLDTKLFPGISSTILVHTGFRNQHSLTARTILHEVKSLLDTKDARHVTVVGSLNWIISSHLIVCSTRLAIHLVVLWRSLMRYTWRSISLPTFRSRPSRMEHPASVIVRLQNSMMKT